MNEPRPGTPRAVLAALLLVTALAYHGALRNGFVWDDAHMIVNNHALDALGSAPRWFTEPETTSALQDVNYRPVLVASFAVDVALWGRRPAGFHAVNLAIHLTVVVLAFVLARRVWHDPWGAVTAAGLVALHPINAEAINYVSARSSLLSTAFALAAIALWRPDQGRMVGSARTAVSLACGLLALGVKESAVVLPLLILIWDRLALNAGGSWRESIRRSLPWWGLVALYLVWRTAVLAGNPPPNRLDDAFWQAPLFVAKIFLMSWWSWFVPVASAVDHGWAWQIGSAEGAALLAGALAAGAGTLVVLRIDPRIGWCVIWFWTALLPLAALPWVSRLTLYQDHRTYLAGIGLAWAGGELLWRATRAFATDPPRRLSAGLLAVAVVAAATAVAVSRTAVWRDADRLWAHTLERYPTSVLAINHQALGRLRAGETDRAREAFERSARLGPGFAVTHNYLGVTYARAGQLDRAVAEFSSAVRISPLFVNARLNLGNAYEQLGRYDAALAAYEDGLPDRPWAVDLIDRAAQLLTRMNRPDEAMERYRRIARIDPDHPSAKAALGRKELN